MKARRETASLRAAAEQHAMYAQELENARYRLQQRQNWQVFGLFLYGLVAFFASAALWSAILPVEMPGVLRVVALILLIGTWVSLLVLRRVVFQKLRIALQRRRMSQ
jgi:hypothetical protein